MAEKKVYKSLGIDFSSLFPSETFDVMEGCSVEIKPMSLVQFASVSKQLKTFLTSLKEKGVHFSPVLSSDGEVIQPINFNTPENIIEIASTALTNFPELLEETSGINKEDLEQLPLDIIINLIDVIIIVNLKSKDKLLGNWRSLVGKIPLVSNLTQKKE